MTARQKAHEDSNHDESVNHLVPDRTSFRDASYASPLDRRSGQLQAVLRHQWVPQLPRAGSRDRDRDLLDLRVRPPDQLTAELALPDIRRGNNAGPPPGPALPCLRLAVRVARRGMTGRRREPTAMLGL